MKRLLATTAFALIASASVAQANDPETVKIRQHFDLPRYEVQDVTNYIGAVTDITNSSLSGTNIQNLLQWRDVSVDGGVGDIYDFSQYTDEEQLVSNTAISSYGDVGAALEAVNIMNYVELEDMLGGTGHVGDHILVDQLVWDTEQKGINTILAKGEVLAGSSASVTNLANVADITGAKGGDPYGDILRLDQLAKYSVQIANNWAEAGSVGGLDMSATNGVNIASFDLSDMSGNANIGISQQTYDVKQTIQNGVRAHGSVADAALSGVNLGSVLTFAVPDVQ